jgi:galactose mutarotase-like enzyme
MLIEKTVGNISFSADEDGAELHSLRVDGEEFLWQCGSAWRRYAPVLFPFICSPASGKYRAGGREYAMPGNHGFARDRKFTLVGETDTSLAFELNSDDETRQWYPYDFRLTVIYEVRDGVLRVINVVQNTGGETLYFYLGGHPAFIADIEGGGDIVEYEKPETIIQDKDGERVILDNENVLRLNRALFDHDVIMKDAPESGFVTLKRANGRFVRLSYPDSKCIAVWTAEKNAQAQFICLEPWTSVPVYADDAHEDIERKPHAIPLDPGQEYNYMYTIEAGCMA